mmetsp:Transcript_82836/g.158107  ORF Transcript_82836/g.158107 Transcript_82836/m.158107 type:complete len:436 (+) Transcript_82836:153-1460(+)
MMLLGRFLLSWLQIGMVTSSGSDAEQCGVGSTATCPDQTALFQRGIHINTDISRHSDNGDTDSVNMAFLRKYKCDAEPTITAAFQRLDANNQGAIRSSDLLMANESRTDSSWLALFTIKGGRAETTYTSNKKWVSERATQYQRALNQILEEAQVPDMKLLISLSDNGDFGPGNQYVLSNDGRPGSDLLFLPRSVLLRGAWANFQTVPHGATRCLHGRHTGVAVFRGSSTGTAWAYDASHPLPLRDANGVVGLRYKVANLSKYRPDLVDAGFTRVVDEDHFAPTHGHEKEFEIALQKEGMIKEPLTDEQQQCYSAVLVVDGHAQADRLARQMMYGIPVIVIHEHKKRFILQQGNATIQLERWQDEFWYGEPRNGQDWLMVDIDELEETLENLLSDPARMAMIGRNGRSFVQERLSERRLKCYMYTLLTEYGKRYRE